jgi:hypothetical protein
MAEDRRMTVADAVEASLPTAPVPTAPPCRGASAATRCACRGPRSAWRRGSARPDAAAAWRSAAGGRRRSPRRPRGCWSPGARRGTAGIRGRGRPSRPAPREAPRPRPAPPARSFARAAPAPGHPLRARRSRRPLEPNRAALVRLLSLLPLGPHALFERPRVETQRRRQGPRGAAAARAPRVLSVEAFENARHPARRHCRFKGRKEQDLRLVIYH